MKPACSRQKEVCSYKLDLVASFLFEKNKLLSKIKQLESAVLEPLCLCLLFVNKGGFSQHCYLQSSMLDFLNSHELCIFQIQKEWRR